MEVVVVPACLPAIKQHPLLILDPRASHLGSILDNIKSRVARHLSVWVDIIFQIPIPSLLSFIFISSRFKSSSILLFPFTFLNIFPLPSRFHNFPLDDTFWDGQYTPRRFQILFSFLNRTHTIAASRRVTLDSSLLHTAYISFFCLFGLAPYLPYVVLYLNSWFDWHWNALLYFKLLHKLALRDVRFPPFAWLLLFFRIMLYINV